MDLKIETHAIITAIEQISSDLAELEEMLRKEDPVIAEALCQLIGRIFWGIEMPLREQCPSLSSLVAVGEKYKKCICRIVEYDRKSKKCHVIKSGIPAEEAIRIFAEMNRKTPENPALSIQLEMEYCASPHDDVASESGPYPRPEWPYRCRIEPKARAALVVKKLVKVSSDLGRQASLLKENKEMVAILNRTLADILTDLYYPIFRAYPSLLPAGLAKENRTYRVVEHHFDSGASFIKASGIISQNAAAVLAEAEKELLAGQDSFFIWSLRKMSKPVRGFYIQMRHLKAIFTYFCKAQTMRRFSIGLDFLLRSSLMRSIYGY